MKAADWPAYPIDSRAFGGDTCMTIASPDGPVRAKTVCIEFRPPLGREVRLKALAIPLWHTPANARVSFAAIVGVRHQGELVLCSECMHPPTIVMLASIFLFLFVSDASGQEASRKPSFGVNINDLDRDPDDVSAQTNLGGVSAGGVAASSPSRRVIEKLLLSARERDPRTGASKTARVSQMTRDVAEFDLVRNLGLIGNTKLVGLLSVERTTRDATAREVGFDSDTISGYGGVSFPLGNNGVVGIGVELGRSTGDLTGLSDQGTVPRGLTYSVSGGDFSEVYGGPVAYVSTGAFGRGLVQAWASYEFFSLDTSKTGFVSAGRPAIFRPFQPQPVSFQANVSTPVAAAGGCCALETESTVDSRELNLGAQAIFDFGAGRYDIFPQAGLEFVRRWSDAFAETWDSVEVRFDEDEATSLQSGFGMGIATVVQWHGVTVQPYVALDWIHEYLDGARTIHASIDDRPIELRTDNPDRDWFEITGEVSFELTTSLNAFVAAQVELGHTYYERTSVFGGVSIPLN